MSKPYAKHKLKNGTTAILVPMKETKAATLLVFYPVGSRHEPSSLAGASHFIEHLMFKGTKRRPDTTHISRELDAVGAEYNAFTGKDHTGYYVKIASEHLPLASDMLSDMLTNSIFDSTEMAREKGVVIEEIHMYEDNPMMHLDDILEEVMYPSSTLGRNIAGSKESMMAMDRDEIIAYRDQFYRPRMTTVVVAGKLPKNPLALLQKTFGVVKEPKTPRPKPFEPVHPEKGEKASNVLVKFKETEQVHLALGWPSYGHDHPSLPALSLLATILGGNMSSRLFINIRERRGICYYIRAGASPYQDVGTFMIQSGLTKARLEEGIEAIMEEVRLVRKDGITKEELNRAKEYLRGKLVLGLEETSEVADWYGRQELFLGKMRTPEEKMRRIGAVTIAQVNKVARDIFEKDSARLALIGPFKDGQPFRKFLKL